MKRGKYFCGYQQPFLVNRFVTLLLDCTFEENDTAMSEPSFFSVDLETVGIQLHPSKFLKPQSHVQTIFLHTEGNISLVNGLFHFQSKHHNGGASIRLLHAMTSNITINGNQRGQVVKALCRGLSRVEPENGPVLKCQNFCEQAVCVSEFAKFPFNFCFLAFEDSKKDNPCNKMHEV